MRQKKKLPYFSEYILYIFFSLFTGLCIIFYLMINDKCRNINEFDFNLIEKNKLYGVLEVECGKIVIEIFRDISPINTARFTELIKKKEYVDSFFYKVKENKLVEVGDLKFGKKTNLDYLKIGTGGSDYSNLKSELNHNFEFSKGSVGMVRRGKFDTENSQIFILITDQKSFNNQYTPIGKVISDLSIIKTIKSSDTDYVLRPDRVLDSYLVN